MLVSLLESPTRRTEIPSVSNYNAWLRQIEARIHLNFLYHFFPHLMKVANSYVKLPAPPYRLGPRASGRSGTESRYGQRMYEILSVLRSFFLSVGYRRILNTHWFNLVKDFSIKMGIFFTDRDLLGYLSQNLQIKFTKGIIFTISFWYWQKMSFVFGF